MPAVQLILLAAAPPDKGEFEAATLTGKQLSIYLFFNPLITHREWQNRAFLKMQVNSQQAGQNQSLDCSLGARHIWSRDC